MAHSKKKLTRKQLHHDPLMEKVTAVTDFAQQHRQRLSYVIGGVAALIIILYAYFSYRDNLNTESLNKLAIAEQIFLGGNHREAIRHLERYVAEWEGTVGGGIGTYYLATAYYQTDQFDFAKQYYEVYVNDYADYDLYTAASMAGIAACWEAMNNYEEAIQQYERVIRKYPDFYLTPDYLLSLARCYRLTQKYDEARQVYERITKEYPESAYARDAKSGLDELS